MSLAARLRPFDGLRGSSPGRRLGSRLVAEEEEAAASLEALADRLGSDQDEFERRLKVDRVAERGAFFVDESQRGLVQAVTQSVLQGMHKLGMDRHAEMMDAVMSITVEPPDLKPVLNAISRMDHHGKHAEMLEAISNIVVEPPDVSSIIRAVGNATSDRHDEMLEALGSAGSPDLTALNRAIMNLNVGGRHQELMQAISSTSVAVEAPDLRPIHRDIQELRSEIKRANEDGQRNFATLASDLRQDLAVLRQEILENRKETRSDAEVLLGELQTLPQAMAELKQSIRKLEQKADISEVLQHVRKIKAEHGPQDIADAVHARSIKVDHSEFINHLKRFEPDHGAMASVLLERLKKTSFNVDHGEVLMALKKFKVDHQQIADAVHERISMSTLNVDHGEVLKEVRRLKREPDLSQVLEAINSMEIDLSPVMQAVAAINFEADHTPVLEEIRRMRQPDHSEIAGILHSKLVESGGIPVDHSEVLSAIRPLVSAINSAEVDLSPVHEEIRKLKDAHNFGPLLHAINQAEVDFTPMIEEIRKINVAGNSTGILQAIASLRSELLFSRGEGGGSLTLPVQTIRSASPTSCSKVQTIRSASPQVIPGSRVIEERRSAPVTLGATTQVVREQSQGLLQPVQSQQMGQPVLSETTYLTPRSYTTTYQSAVQGASSPPQPQGTPRGWPLTGSVRTIGSSLGSKVTVAPAVGFGTTTLLTTEVTPTGSTGASVTLPPGSGTLPASVDIVDGQGSIKVAVGTTDVTLEGFDALDTSLSAVSPRRSSSSPGPLVRRGPPRRNFGERLGARE